MNIAFFGSGYVGYRCAVALDGALRGTDHRVVAVVTHDSADGLRHRQSIINVLQVDSTDVFAPENLTDPRAVQWLKDLNPQRGFSCYYGHKLPDEILGIMPIVNLHPSLLPYGRGSYTPIWTIIDERMAGVTLHHMTSDIDAGAIIAQRAIETTAYETGQTLDNKLKSACIDLFTDCLPELLASTLPDGTPQPAQNAQPRRKRDVEAWQEIDLDGLYYGRSLINMIRARTFDKFPGVYFKANGRKIYLKLALLPEDEVNHADPSDQRR